MSRLSEYHCRCEAEITASTFDNLLDGEVISAEKKPYEFNIGR